MDTTTAIATQEELVATITRDIENLTAQITEKQKIIDSSKVAISQLQGILDTPSEDLAIAKATIDDLTTQVQAREAIIADLKPLNEQIS
jgi:peptidoglycan hydrolase CwlO-like protein